jgi:hypothetical protein
LTINGALVEHLAPKAEKGFDVHKYGCDRMRLCWWRTVGGWQYFRPMSRVDLQPGIAQAGIVSAQCAGQAAATFEPAGPVATGALSLIDAAAGLAHFAATTAQASRASALLAHTEAVGAAATTSVATLVAIDETNAEKLQVVAADI